ncbi:winged helix-turn-helix domain-containing protein [Vibrio bivalvicida]|uniref:OmpR/PhoB-type domain-containing protein n=1 Tax=Vibrio bivalvicida TaxID=1276888 RepID=A0A177XX57_9VIBR|nr:winged helix-turn-helix domain-containing protein [Vibrio bivalvicida]OAJ93151.1 hypothetical protein APB76_14375 [Vibrio bivalvicida]
MKDDVCLGEKKLHLSGDVYLIEESRSVKNSRNGSEAVFSCTEVAIIKELVLARGKALSRRYLLDKCWSGRIVTNTSLSVAINKIRERFKNIGLRDAIITVPRHGYQINLTSEERLGVEPLFLEENCCEKDSSIIKPIELSEMLKLEDEGNNKWEGRFLISEFINEYREYLIILVSWLLSTILITLFFFC